MPQHEVDVTLPKRELGRADAVFDVKADGVTLGALHVSRGAVVWFPANATYGHKLDWSAFAQMMVENGVRSERR
jgi:hypothetical protein